MQDLAAHFPTAVEWRGGAGLDPLSFSPSRSGDVAEMGVHRVTGAVGSVRNSRPVFFNWELKIGCIQGGIFLSFKEKR